jgi:hypothetical protein
MMQFNYNPHMGRKAAQLDASAFALRAQLSAAPAVRSVNPLGQRGIVATATITTRPSRRWRSKPSELNSAVVAARCSVGAWRWHRERRAPEVFTMCLFVSRMLPVDSRAACKHDI